MSFQYLKTAMHWPDSEEVFSPSGAGPRVLVKLARDKIGKSVERRLDGSANVKVGLLTKAPKADSTVAPIAVVCEFTRPISHQHLAETHRLAWNFSRAPLASSEEQKVIVEKVVEKLSQLESLQFEVERGLKRAARLRQSILKAAFDGKLVPQDATEEPAKVLLDRIREQAAADEFKPKRKPRKKSSRKAKAK